MKDANGSRFELLLGPADWGRCTLVDSDGVQHALAEGWMTAAGRDRLPLAYDAESASLQLARRISRFRAAPSDTPPDPARRLGATVDAFGNVYWLAEGGMRIDTLWSGSRSASLYAPANRADAPRPHALGDFAPAPAARPMPTRVLRGLALTTEHYLVAGLAPGVAQLSGLRAFDLIAGGPPLEIAWPITWPFAPHDLAPRPGGGLAVLDRAHGRVWMLDRRLGMKAMFPVDSNNASRADDFTAMDADVSATAAPSAPALPWFDLAIDAAGGRDPVAVQVLDDDAVLVMDAAGTDGFALVTLYVDGQVAARASTRVVLDLIEADDRASFVLRGHACALAPRPADHPQRLVIASHEGNQCYAFDLLRGSPALTLDPIETFLPMRRFGGKGLVRRVAKAADIEVSQDTGLMYDGAGTWLPLVAQSRPRFAPTATLTTAVLDSQVVDCTWHRMIVDGCIPPGCTLLVESRAADTPDALAEQRFRSEPRPILRPDGAEVPWLRDVPGAHTDVAAGKGSWELLYQHAQGRYLQMRLTLNGNEISTPRLVALRAWNPRFSYLREYLPAIYREDESSADFLERFLANFEGMFTSIEDRIVAAIALFDARTAPDATLDWLASWIGLVFDPAIDAPRKRLLIRHAMPLFAFRGTPQGLRLATELVLSSCIRPQEFALRSGAQTQPYGIRVVERYLTRRLPRAVLGDTVSDAPRRLAETDRWTTAEGADGLQRRFRKALESAGVGAAETTTFRPVAPAESAAAWSDFCATQLGAVPQLASTLAAHWQSYLATLADRAGMGPELPTHWPIAPAQQDLWQDFLARGIDPGLRRWLTRWQSFIARRYLRSDDATFIASWGAWPSFDLLPSPDVLPLNARALADWALFETRLEAMAQTAHRFSVLLPATGPLADEVALARQIQFAQRVVRLEKPAHTAFDVRPYWAMFRIGQARIGMDTLLGTGSRAPELAPQLVIGNGRVGASRVATQRHAPGDRLLLAC
jgi:phage tail-like protein